MAQSISSETTEKDNYRIVAFKKDNPSIQSTSNIISIAQSTQINIPNAFTPNDDGINDSFKIYGTHLKEFQLQIYNRWGEMVFETQDPEETWDGKYEGKIVQQGVYDYILKAKETTTDFPIVKSGIVSLIL